MIIVLLLFFQSICLYCQRLVLYIHDRWINPKNVRLQKEAAETSAITGKQILSNCSPQRNRNKKRAVATTELGAESCRFCANTPQGYCRHHFHLQERQLQQEQHQQSKHFWSNIAVGGDKSLEQRQQRKVNRELKRSLKNQLSSLRPTQQKPQQILKHSLYSNSSQNNNSYQELTDDDKGYQSASNASLSVLQHTSISTQNNSISSSQSSEAFLNDSILVGETKPDSPKHSKVDNTLVNGAT